MKLIAHTQRSKLAVEDSSVDFKEKGSDFKIVVDRSGIRFEGKSNPMVTQPDVQEFARSFGAAVTVFEKKFRLPLETLETK